MLEKKTALGGGAKTAVTFHLETIMAWNAVELIKHGLPFTAIRNWATGR